MCFARCLATAVALTFAAPHVSPLRAQTATSESLADREQAAIRAAVERVAESVVQIRTIGGLDTVDGSIRADGPTSGLIISPDGYILSSAVNFVEEPASILVTFASGRQAPATRVATDHSRMLVLLKVNEAAELPVADVAPADELRVGQWAIAVGRTFRTDRPNVAVGIVSAVNRMFGKALQTDAAVSAANYGGPLIDIHGRVLGILVPMAPQSASEVAGVEWYDSGIGFAVPLASIEDDLERMKPGEDQRAGILGIGMAGKNPHESSAELAAVRPDSPAGMAGLRKDDRIIEIDGTPIKTQTDLRFALGPRYSGESVRIVAMRGEERIERTITLAGELAPFRHAFLGVLPVRIAATNANEEAAANESDDNSNADISATGEDDAEIAGDAVDEDPAGVEVRMVYADSPAAAAGIQADDRIVQINDTRPARIADAIAAMNNAAPDMKIDVHVRRGAETLQLAATASRLPTTVPNDLPSAAPSDTSAQNENTGPKSAIKPGESLELKLPEFENECRVYVPASQVAMRPMGVLLWLHAPGESEPEETIQDWQSICDRDGVLLVLPTASDAEQWERTELEYLRRLLERIVMQYPVDPRRIAVYGQSGGGAMAYFVGLSGRDLVRGIATSAAPLPRQVKVPANEPSQRLAVLSATPTGHAPHGAQIMQGLKKLADAGYPVTTLTIVDSAGGLSQSEREELARWIDTLDRF